MEITWIGGSCFRFRGREAAVVTDPQTSGLTQKSSFPKADLVAISVPDRGLEAENLVQANHRDGVIFVASGPGEYDVSGVYLRGLAGSKVVDGTQVPIVVYTMDIERVTVAYITRFTEEFDSVLLDELGTVQVLIVNADNNADGVASLVSRLEPNIVVPFGTGSNGRIGWFDVARDLSEVELMAEASLNISASELPEPVTTRVLSQRVT